MRGRVFDCRKHSNIKRNACYRRIRGGRYYKSIAKYQSEKRRRKQILKLQMQGYSIKQIAVLLGVSRRTVHRDLEKLRSYTQAKQNQLGWENFMFRSRLNDRDLAKAICEYREVIRKARQRAQVKTLTIRVNVDAAFEGRHSGAVSFVPRLPADVADWGKIAFELQVEKQVLEIACLYTAIPYKNRLILGTNLSKDPTRNPPLLGLQIIDPANPEYTSYPEIRQIAQIQRRMFNQENPWHMQEFQDLKPERQDKLLQQYNELCGRHNRLLEAKTLTVTLNVDQALNAAYSANFTPHLPVALSDHSKIILKLQASTKIQHLITLLATDIEHGLVNIEKSFPYSKPKFNSLKGLEIINKSDAANQQADTALV